MIDAQETSRSSRSADLPAYFLERARQYRFAAAMTENPHEIERLCEVALMFEAMARDTERSAPYSRLRAATGPKPECPSTTDCKPGFLDAWLYRFVRVGRFIRQRARISRMQGRAG